MDSLLLYLQFIMIFSPRLHNHLLYSVTDTCDQNTKICKGVISGLIWLMGFYAKVKDPAITVVQKSDTIKFVFIPRLYDPFQNHIHRYQQPYSVSLFRAIQ